MKVTKHVKEVRVETDSEAEIQTDGLLMEKGEENEIELQETSEDDRTPFRTIHHIPKSLNLTASEEKMIRSAGVRPRDECDLFGELVACKLHKLHNERVRSNVQQMINTILWEAESGKYDNHHPSTVSEALTTVNLDIPGASPHP